MRKTYQIVSNSPREVRLQLCIPRSNQQQHQHVPSRHTHTEHMYTPCVYTHTSDYTCVITHTVLTQTPRVLTWTQTASTVSSCSPLWLSRIKVHGRKHTCKQMLSLPCSWPSIPGHPDMHLLQVLRLKVELWLLAHKSGHSGHCVRETKMLWPVAWLQSVPYVYTQNRAPHSGTVKSQFSKRSGQTVLVRLRAATYRWPAFLIPLHLCFPHSCSSPNHLNPFACL